MIKCLLFSLCCCPLFLPAQELSTVAAIDSMVRLVDRDPGIVKTLYDTATWEKEDGGTNWDSAYHHREFYYKDGQLVKVIAWNKYMDRRNDMEAYYYKGNTIKFSKGESFEGMHNYGRLEFAIYYYRDKDIHVEWLQPKPPNVVGVGADAFLNWSHQLKQDAGKEER